MEELIMLLLSHLLGQPVRDAGSQEIATLRDLVGRWQMDQGLVVAGLVAGVGRRRFFLPWQQVAGLGDEGARLSSYQVNFQQFERRSGEILLAGDVTDQKLIDVRHRKVIRVNDVVLNQIDGRVVVVGVDVGTGALLRRLAPRWLSSSFSRVKLVDWVDVEWLPSDAYPIAKTSFPHLARLHPVEVAHIVNELPHRQGADIVESLGDEEAAEVLSEVSDQHQAGVLMNMDGERAADILEEMEPDDAADLLARLSPEEAGDLLNRMETDEARDVQALMEYKEGTAGGLMTNRFVTVPQGWSAADAIEMLRRMEDRPETITHLLAVEGPESLKLAGVVPLLDVVLASPTEELRALMASDVPSVEPDTSTSEVARKMAEYNLALVPVVNEEGEILGVVAVDDIVEEMLPERWRRRLPRLFG
jgi:magnesium transporter